MIMLRRASMKHFSWYKHYLIQMRENSEWQIYFTISLGVIFHHTCIHTMMFFECITEPITRFRCECAHWTSKNNAMCVKLWKSLESNWKKRTICLKHEKDATTAASARHYDSHNLKRTYITLNNINSPLFDVWWQKKDMVDANLLFNFQQTVTLSTILTMHSRYRNQSANSISAQRYF